MEKIFFEIWENFFEYCTTVYKAGFSKLDDLYNLVTKIITKYPVLTTFKILKNKKNLQFFEKNFRHFVPQILFKNIGDVFFTIFENSKSC